MVDSVSLSREEFIKLVEHKMVCVSHNNKILTIKLRADVKEDKFLKAKVEEVQNEAN